MNNIVPENDQVLALERRLKWAEVIEGASNSPDVYFEIVRLMLYELRRQVERSADSSALKSRHGGDYLWNAQVSNLETLVLLGDEDV